mgnify:CR=1 FL=1
MTKRMRGGPALLRAARLERAQSRATAAYLLDVHPSMVLQLEGGAKRPGLQLALRIADIYGVPPAAWVRA